MSPRGSSSCSRKAANWGPHHDPRGEQAALAALASAVPASLPARAQNRTLPAFAFAGVFFYLLASKAATVTARMCPVLLGRDMNDVTRILAEIEQGDTEAAENLLPLVYDELRRLAAAKLVHENPGQTLQATALVHEAYLRLIGKDNAQQWDSRGHFFSAAAEAMRRILIDQARRKKSQRQGGGLKRHDLEYVEIAAAEPTADLLALDEALSRFEAKDRIKAELVKLRYFAGLTVPQAAKSLGISPATADRYWAYARAWLHAELASGESPDRS